MEHRINIGYPNIVQRIQKDLSELQKDLSELQSLDSECCIYRVHEGLRKVKPEAYEPMVVSIGPHHLQNPTLQAMKRHKLLSLNSLLKRRNNESVERYIGEFQKLEDRVRTYYAEPIDLSSEKFVEMMLLDACFIIEFFRNKSSNKTKYGAWKEKQIYRDLMLLENQLPFFLLSHLYDMTKEDTGNPNHNPNNGPEDPDHDSDNILEDPNHNPVDDDPNHDLNDNPEDPIYNPNENREDPNHNPTDGNSFKEMAVSCFPHSTVTPWLIINKKFVKTFDPRDIKHLLHLVHVLCHPSSKSTSPSRSASSSELTISRKAKNVIKHLSHRVHNLCRPLLKPKRSELNDAIEYLAEAVNKRMHSAVELEEAGVKFKKVYENLFDIKFKDGLMEVPYFSVEDSTDTFFRNLIAFEQHSSYVDSKYFTDFASFMNQLINTEKDVKLLRHAGIIENCLGDDEEVSNFFNRLADGIIVFEFGSNYSGVRLKVIEHCKKSWNKTRAKLCHDYFNSPWVGISTFGAIMLLVLTIIQTVNSF